MRYKREISVAAAYAGLLIVLAVSTPSFFSAANLRDVALTSAPLLLIAVGMTVVILARHIDISVGSEFAIAGVAAGLLAKSGVPMPVVAVLTVVVGALLGAINGGLAAGLGLPSIVVTLATMVAFREALRWSTEGADIQDLPARFQWFGLGQNAGQALILVVAIVVFAIFAAILRYAAAGRAVYAVGSNEEAARLVGIRPRRVGFSVFVLLGALTGLAALLNAICFPSVQTNAGNGLEMKVIAAVVVGGTAVTGGRGTLLGTLLGVLVLGTLGTALTFLHVSAHWERAVQGMVILIAVCFARVESGLLRPAQIPPARSIDSTGNSRHFLSTRNLDG